MADPKLPPLPECDSYCTHADLHDYDVWNADQMREYALAAIAANAKTSLDYFIDDVEAADIRDAARYRHLVATCNVDFDPSEPWQLVIWEPGTGEDWKAKLDAAIDEAMKGEQP